MGFRRLSAPSVVGASAAKAIRKVTSEPFTKGSNGSGEGSGAPGPLAGLILRGSSSNVVMKLEKRFVSLSLGRAARSEFAWGNGGEPATLRRPLAGDDDYGWEGGGEGRG